MFEDGNGENVRVKDLEDEKGQLTKQTLNYLARSLGGKDRLQMMQPKKENKIINLHRGLSSS